MNLGTWHVIPQRTDVPTIASISGGRSSAMMAALTDPSVMLCFQNTGREHPKTYAFLVKLEEALQRTIVWLEYRPPLRRGAPPKESRFEVVTPETANKAGMPFELMLEALKDFRATKGLGPIAPWPRSRICTAYLKIRTQARYVQSLAIETWDSYIGLRADEPERVKRLVSTSAVVRRAPLHELGVTKRDVNIFWANQAFDLEIPDYLGNCTGCFLKDQADLSRALGDVETDFPWWQRMESQYPGFGGKIFVGYSRLAAEGSVRQQISDALARGVSPKEDSTVSPQRFKAIVRQERKRMATGSSPFSCACESAENLAESDALEEEAYLLSLDKES